MDKKLAIVTGAGTGIGQAIAIELAKNGYDVGVHYFGSEEGAQETVAQCRKQGVRAECFKADLSKKAEIDSFFAAAVAFLGGLTLFVNNSGVTQGMPFTEITEEHFDFLVGVDMKSALFCTQAAANTMIANGTKGNIVVIASSNAYMQKYRFTVYGMIKAGLVKMVKHEAIELAQYGIRVNAVAPGWVSTPRVMKTADYDKVTASIPMRRMATSEECAQMVLFYASDAAKSITGDCMLADGGYTLVNDNPEVYGF